MFKKHHNPSTNESRDNFIRQLREQKSRHEYEYKELANKLENCKYNDYPNRRCHEHRLCPRCNYNNETARWKRTGFNKTSALLAAGAIPISMRGSVPECTDIKQAISHLLHAIEAFCLPFKSCYSMRASDPRSRSVVSGRYGIHIDRGSVQGTWHAHMHMVIWLRPGSIRSVDLVKSLLKASWIASSGCSSNGVYLRRFFQHKPVIKSTLKLHRYLDKTYLASVAYLTPDEYLTIEAAMRNRRHTQEFGIWTKTLRTQGRLEQLDITHEEVDRLLRDGEIRRIRRNRTSPPAIQEHTTFQLRHDVEHVEFPVFPDDHGVWSAIVNAYRMSLVE